MIIGCGPEPVCSNTTASGSGTSNGDSRTYTCNAGFSGSNTTRTCSSDTWGGFCPTCTFIPQCGSAPPCSNATASGTGTSQGDTRTYTCNPGSSGSSTSRTCDASGNWNGSCPSCIVAGSCGSAPVCPNTTVSGSGTSDGDSRTYTCGVGYIGPTPTSTCGAGAWSGSCPACSIDGCGPQPTCPNAFASGVGTSDGSSLIFTCLTDSSISKTIPCVSDPDGDYWGGSCPSC